MDMNIKRAFVRVEKLIWFLTETPGHGKMNYSTYWLPTVEDARVIILYLNSSAEKREYLKEQAETLTGCRVEWTYYLTTTGPGEKLFNQAPEICQEVITAFALLEQAAELLEELEEQEFKRQEAEKHARRAEVLGMINPPAEAVSIQEEGQGRGEAVELPAELATENALKYWRKAQAAGWVKDDFSFNGTRYQMAYFAEAMGERLELKNNRKWVPFKELWKFDKFAQTRRESKERFGKVENSKEIDSLFED